MRQCVIRRSSEFGVVDWSNDVSGPTWAKEINEISARSIGKICDEQRDLPQKRARRANSIAAVRSIPQRDKSRQASIRVMKSRVYSPVTHTRDERMLHAFLPLPPVRLQSRPDSSEITSSRVHATCT